jgi:hypothetical protein
MSTLHCQGYNSAKAVDLKVLKHKLFYFMLKLPPSSKDKSFHHHSREVKGSCGSEEVAAAEVTFSGLLFP